MNEFIAERTIRSFVQKILARPATVFPLLCPVREYEWIEPWRCRLLHSNSGFAEKNCVFTTRSPGEASDDVWVISRYEPVHGIEFVRVNAMRVMCYSIELEDNGDGTTTVTNEQTLIGLNAGGNEFIRKERNSDSFAFEMRMGEAMLNHYVVTGKRLPLKDAVALASRQST